MIVASPLTRNDIHLSIASVDDKSNVISKGEKLVTFAPVVCIDRNQQSTTSESFGTFKDA